MSNGKTSDLEIARCIRDACITAANEEFRNAAMSGLCMDGAAEAAVGAMKSLDLEEVLQKAGLDK